MSDPRTDLPSPNAPNFEARIRETLMTYLGRQGNALDRGITLRDLLASGLVRIPEGYTPRPGAPVPLTPTTPPNAEPDLTPPPQPTGFSAASAISHIFIEHDAPLYSLGGGHLRTRVYGVTLSAGDPLPVFADAVELTQFSGTVHAYPSNPATTWRLWIKWESQAGVLSPTPAGGTNGLAVTTAQDVSPLLQALTGQITESELFGALGERIDLIDGLMPGSVNARIQAEASARALALQAEASARETTDASLLAQIQLLEDIAGGDVSALIAQLNQEIADRIAGDLAEANARELAGATLAASVTQEAAARQSADAATAAQVTQVLASTGNTAAALVVEQSTRAAADGASATQLQVLSSATGDNQAAITNEQLARSTADAAAVSQAATLGAAVGGALAGIQSEQSARAQADSAASGQLSSLVAITTGASSSLQVEQQVRATSDSATAARLDSLAAVSGGNAAAIATEAAARSTQDGAIASQLTTLSVEVGTNTAAVQQEATVRASETGELFAKYTVKIDVNGYVSGFGLASTANNATPFSDFAVRADRFYIASPSGPGIPPAMPFTVQTTATTLNGVAVPAGVYMADAFIQNGSITNAKIANLSVDNAKIANLSADKLTAGSIAVGQHIQSTGYVAGSAGWRINGDGTAEFSGVVVRGTVFATAGEIGGITIASNAVRAGQTAFNTGQGFHLSSDGRFSLGNSAGNRLTWSGSSLEIVSNGLNISGGSAEFSGNLSAVGGTFSGALTGATGTFSGELLAGTVDVTKLVGQLHQFTSPGTYSLVVPVAFTQMRVTLVGAGGGGGGEWIYEGTEISYAGGAGGGSGGFSSATFTVTPGVSVQFIVGSGGSGGAGVYTNILSGQANAGANGGLSQATGYLVAGGGVGGGGGRSPVQGDADRLSIPGAGGTGNPAGNSGQPGTNIYDRGGNGAGGASRYGNYGRGGNGTRNRAFRTPGAGIAGAHGFVQVEFFNPNGVIIRSDWNTLQAALIRQNIQVV